MSSSSRRPRGGAGGPGRAPRTKRADRPAPRELQPILDPPEIASFEAWDLDPGVQQGIRNMDIAVPTPIQALSIQPILDGRDLIAKAETGTGKTLAFGAPIISKVDPERATVLALIVCPTRELAQQVAGVMSALGAPRKITVALLVGGDPLRPQVDELRRGAQVVVGTPGRILDLYQQRFLSFPWTEFAVLDEADKMFEIGFLDDVRKILSLLPDERQTLLFSATYPAEVLGLAREFTRDPVEVATARGLTTVAAIEQRFIRFEAEEERAMALIRLIEESAPEDVFLVFGDRRTDVDKLLRRMERETFSVKALHGGYDQASRFRVMSAFRTGEVKALLATDVASRGLDVEHVTHVINYSVPRDAESYTHRIGRTGRAGRSGMSITFVQPADHRRFEAILRGVTWPIEEMDAPTGRRGRGRAPEARGRGRNAEPSAPSGSPAERGSADERGGRPPRSRRDETAAPASPPARPERGERSTAGEPAERPRRSGRRGSGGSERNAERGAERGAGRGAERAPERETERGAEPAPQVRAERGARRGAEERPAGGSGRTRSGASPERGQQRDQPRAEEGRGARRRPDAAPEPSSERGAQRGSRERGSEVSSRRAGATEERGSTRRSPEEPSGGAPRARREERGAAEEPARGARRPARSGAEGGSEERDREGRAPRGALPERGAPARRSGGRDEPRAGEGASGRAQRDAEGQARPRRAAEHPEEAPRGGSGAPRRGAGQAPPKEAPEGGEGRRPRRGRRSSS